MNKQQIKTELIRRVRLTFRKYDNPSDSALRALANRAGSVEKFAQDITDTLNQILRENNFSFGDKENEEIIVYLRPTITDLLADYVTDVKRR